MAHISQYGELYLQQMNRQRRYDMCIPYAHFLIFKKLNITTMRTWMNLDNILRKIIPYRETCVA